MSLLLLALACLLLWLSRHRHVFAPTRMFLYGWLLVLGVTSLGMARYDRPLAIETFLLVASSMLAFWVGARLVPTGNPASAIPYGRLRDDFDRLTLAILCALSVVGIGIVLRDLASGGLEVIFNFSIESSIVRSARWEAYYAGEQSVSPIRSFGIVSGLAIATLLPYATKCRKPGLLVLSFLSAVAVVTDSLLSAGRFQLGVLAMALVISTALVYGNLRMLTVRRVLLGLAIGAYFFVIFPTQRNPNLADYAERSLWREADASFAPWVEQAATLPGFAWLEVVCGLDCLLLDLSRQTELLRHRNRRHGLVQARTLQYPAAQPSHGGRQRRDNAVDADAPRHRRADAPRRVERKPLVYRDQRPRYRLRHGRGRARALPDRLRLAVRLR